MCADRLSFLSIHFSLHRTSSIFFKLKTQGDLSYTHFPNTVHIVVTVNEALAKALGKKLTLYWLNLQETLKAQTLVVEI